MTSRGAEGIDNADYIRDITPGLTPLAMHARPVKAYLRLPTTYKRSKTNRASLRVRYLHLP